MSAKALSILGFIMGIVFFATVTHSVAHRLLVDGSLYAMVRLFIWCMLCFACGLLGSILALVSTDDGSK